MKYKFLILLVIIVGCIISGRYFYKKYNGTLSNTSGHNKNSKEGAPDKFYTLKRKDLIIGIIQSGTVNARKKFKLALEVPFRTKLLWIVKENKRVRKGEILAKFETEDLEMKIEDMRIQKENLEKDLAIALEEKKILETSNKAAIKSAEDKVAQAEDAYRKYNRFEKHKQRDSLDMKLEETKKAYEEAESEYNAALDKFNSESYINEKEKQQAEKKLSALRHKLEQSKINYQNVILDLKVFKRYDLPARIAELENKLTEAKLQLKKIKIETESKMIQKAKAISNLKTRLRKVTRRLQKHEEYLKKMQLVSPADGVVIYGDPDRRWGKIEIKIGMDIDRGRVLLTIPDMSNLFVDFDLPEEYRFKVNVGQKVFITPDSIPTLSLTGKIEKIASLPVNQIFWDRTSPKIYKSVASIDKFSKELVCGMNVQLDIITKVIKSVLCVPVEAVFEENDKYFVYLKTCDNKYKKVFISIGSCNDNFVEITSGLKENDVVYLFKPFRID